MQPSSRACHTHTHTHIHTYVRKMRSSACLSGCDILSALTMSLHAQSNTKRSVSEGSLGKTHLHGTRTHTHTHTHTHAHTHARTHMQRSDSARAAAQDSDWRCAACGMYAGVCMPVCVYVCVCVCVCVCAHVMTHRSAYPGPAAGTASMTSCMCDASHMCPVAR